MPTNDPNKDPRDVYFPKPSRVLSDDYPEYRAKLHFILKSNGFDTAKLTLPEGEYRYEDAGYYAMYLFPEKGKKPNEPIDLLGNSKPDKPIKYAPLDWHKALFFIRVPKIEMTKPDGFYAEYEFGRERFFLFGDSNNKKKVIQGDVYESEQVPSMAPQWMQKNGQLGIYDPRKEPKFTVLREPAIIMDLDDGTVTNFGEVEDLKAPLKNWMAHHREHKGSWVVAFIRVDTIPASYLNIMFGDPAYAKQLGWTVIEQSIKNGSMDGRIKAEPHLEWLTRRFPNLTEDQLQRSRKNWSPEQFDRLEQANYAQDPTRLAPGL